MRSGKVKPSLQALNVALDAGRAYGQRVVLCPGVYDLLHLGHVSHLRAARGHGDVLVVTVTPDEHVGKGPGRPAFNQSQRAEMVASLSCVDYVCINEFPDHAGTIRLLKPHAFVRGSEYESASYPAREAEVAACEAVQCVAAYTNCETFSSSSLINRHLPTVPAGAAGWLRSFVHAADQVEAHLAGAASLKVLVAGEAITDEYVWVEALGKSGKEPILAVRELSREQHDGGATAVANHVRQFAKQAIQWSAGESVTKTRFVTHYPQQKLVEVYGSASEYVPTAGAYVGNFAPDLSVIVDYGHGMFNGEMKLENIGFLAVNVQNNAGNYGYNTHEKYGHIDYLCLSEGELRLAARQRNGDLKELVVSAAQKHGCSFVTVTRGRDGVLCWKCGVFCEAPAFSDHFADRVGAGDAVLAVTSLLACQGASVEVIALVANAVGALAVNIVGNRESVQKAALQKFVQTLLK